MGIEPSRGSPRGAEPMAATTTRRSPSPESSTQRTGTHHGFLAPRELFPLQLPVLPGPSGEDPATSRTRHVDRAQTNEASFGSRPSWPASTLARARRARLVAASNVVVELLLDPSPPLASGQRDGDDESALRVDRSPRFRTADRRHPRPPHPLVQAHRDHGRVLPTPGLKIRTRRTTNLDMVAKTVTLRQTDFRPTCCCFR